MEKVKLQEFFAKNIVAAYKNPKDAIRRIVYTEWGDKNNPNIVLCVHGLTRNGRDFDFLAHELSKEYRVICPDIIGRGKSQWLEDKDLYNYNTYVSDVLELIDYLKPLSLIYIGTSMGGIIGMTIDAMYPGKIDKLILNDIGAFIPGNTLKRISKYVGIDPSFDNLTEAQKHVRMILAHFGIKDDKHWDYITLNSIRQDEVTGKYKLAYDPGIARIFETTAIADVNIWHLWEKVTAKTLIIRGKLSDILLEETAIEMLSKKGASVKLVEFDGSGHAPSLMDDEQIRAITNWIGS